MNIDKAAEEGSLQHVREALKAGVDVDTTDEGGGTALIKASFCGHEEVVETLLKGGATVDMQDKEGWAALIVASEKGHERVVEALLKGGATVDMQNKEGSTALILASQNGHEVIVETLLKRGASVDMQTKNGSTALTAASFNGHERVVESLLKGGATVDIQEEDGSTALAAASFKGHGRVVEVLLKGGATVDMQKENGFTALMSASQEGHEVVVQALLKGGAKVDMQMEDGWTALMSASWNNHPKVVEKLLTVGSKPDHLKTEGGTALMYASQEGHEVVVETLLKGGATVDMQSKRGNTALSLARMKGHQRVVKLLHRASTQPEKKDEQKVESTDGPQAATATECLEEDGTSPPVQRVEPDERPSAHQSLSETDVLLENLLQKYRHQGTIRHKSLKCLFTGPPRVGKTTLRKRIMKTIKNLISSGEISTSGGLEKPITVVIGEARECVTVVMDPNYMDWHLQHDLLDEAQIVLQFIDQQATPNHESVPQELYSHVSFEPDTHIRTPRDTSPSVILTPSEEHPNPPPTHENRTASLDDARKLMEEVLASRGLHSIKDIEKTTTLYLMDTGGQPEFHEIMPIILPGPALHMVLFNLAFNLNEPIPVRFCQQDGTNAMITYESNYTGIQMIYQLLSSLYCLSKDSSMHSSAVLIGTHLDQLKDLEEQGKKRIAEINGSLKQLLTNAEFHKQAFLTYPVQDHSAETSTVFVPVDNYNGSEEEIEQLQAFLKQVIDNHFDPVELPSAWHLFHLALRHRYENSPGVCSLADCEALAEGCGLDKDDVPLVLRYIHQNLGTVLYYEEVQGLNQLVICDPNVLFRGIFHIVGASFAGGRPYHTSAAEIRKTGEIPVRLLDRISAQPSNSPLTNEHILALLKHFKILTELHSGDDAAYFMPCLLQPDTSLELSCELLQKLCPPPLLVCFDGNYIPIGVFSAVVVKLSQGPWEPNPATRYRNRILFFTDGISSVELIVYPAYLEFRITIADLEEPSEINEFCMGVRQTVVDTLKSALELHEHTKKTKFQLGFYCPGSFQTDGQPHLCGCLPSQNHINPKTFACSPCCQNQRRLNDEYTIWFGYWKDTSKAATGRNSGLDYEVFHPVNYTSSTDRGTVPDYGAVHRTVLTASLQTEAVSSPLRSSILPTSASPRKGTGNDPVTPTAQLKACHIASDERPNFLKLLNFPGRSRNISIPQQIGTKYFMFGVLLLNDDTGAEVNAIATKHRDDAEQINLEVLRLWIGGKGKPLSWDILTDVLRASGLDNLATDIQDSLDT